MLDKFYELRLIAQCVAGDDRRAFGRLVDEYSDGLRRFLLNLTLGDASLTDDLAQETFLKAWLSLRSYQGLARFRTWLYRIAYNEYYMYVRKRRELPDTNDSILDTVTDTVSPYSAYDARMDVEQCLKVLSEPERTAVLLFYLDDRPIKEIAEIMQMPQGTVKSHLSRAKAKMARIF